MADKAELLKIAREKCANLSKQMEANAIRKYHAYEKNIRFIVH